MSAHKSRWFAGYVCAQVSGCIALRQGCRIHSFNSGLRYLTLFVIWFFVPASPCLRAQVDTGAIVGTVTDQSGAVVPGVSVTIRRLETNQTFVTETTHTGDYRVELLPVGSYQIETALPGFKTARRLGVKLEVGRIIRVDFVVTVGEVAESVEVTSSAPLLTSEKAEFSQLIDQRKEEGLPINSRDFTQ